MHERFLQHLTTLNEVAKDQHEAEFAPDPRKEADLQRELSYVLNRQANARSASVDAQYDIHELQREKQEVMREMHEALSALDNSDALPDPVFLTGPALTYTEQGCMVGGERVTQGEVLANLSLGKSYNLSAPGIPRSLKKHYLVEYYKVTLREKMNQQILTDQLSSDRVDDFKKNAYQGIADRTPEEVEQKRGLIVEAVVTNYFKRLQFDTDLDFKFEEADAYQDVNQKIDFIIRRTNRRRGVDVQEGSGASGIQFTTNISPEVLEKKSHQVERANARLTENDHVQDIMLVTLSPQAAHELCDAYHTFQRQDVHSIDYFLSEPTKRELFENILKGIYAEQAIEEQWSSLNKDPQQAPVQGGEAVNLEQQKEVIGTFEQAVKHLRDTNIQLTEQQAVEQRCYYHNGAHAEGVERRAAAIIRAIAQADGRTDTAHLLALSSLAAAVHDVRQIFTKETQRGNPRSRKVGESEAASVRLFLDQVDDINREAGKELITGDDIEQISEAIDCTIAHFSTEQGIVQSELTTRSGLVARAIALADLGALGMEGYYAFQEDDIRVFLEENPDLFDVIWDADNGRFDLSAVSQDEKERMHGRIKRRSDFKIFFAEKRLEAFEAELEGLSEAAKREVGELFRGFRDAVEDVRIEEMSRQLLSLEELLEVYNFAEFLPEYRQRTAVEG
ncbi:hypothetical protein BH11PAT4_BH11PAT4_7680 [soil metagenome]